LIDKKSIPENFEAVELDVTGMECVNCASSIKTYLEKLNGIHNVDINFTSEVANVAYNPNVILIKDIVADIRKLGYDVIEADDEEIVENIKKQKLKSEKYNIIVSAVLTAIIMLVSMSGHHGMFDLMLNPLFSLASLLLLTSYVIFINGKKFLVGAYNSAKILKSDMNTLVSMGVLSSYLYSLVIAINHIFSLNLSVLRNSHEVYFETSAMIITLILVGNYLESVLKSKTQTSIKKLKDLQAKFVNVIRNGEDMLVPFKKVKVNDLVVIRSGDKIPVDGVIEEGFCVIDESAMTGESLMVEKKKDDRLISGTLMKNGFVKMKALKVGKDTTLSKIISLVKEASNSKPQIQRLADKISSIFVPVVVSIAVITFLAWYFIFGTPFDESLLFAVSVLVVACPCALGLASPMAVVIGVGRAAENGILFNNVEAIEKLNKIDTICFDKTGTITTGEMQLKSIKTFNDIPESDLMKYVFSVEKFSNHPIAKSVINYCIEKQMDIFNNVSDIINEDGMGISGKVDDKVVLIGSPGMMEKFKVEQTELIDNNQSRNLYVSIDNKLSGEIAFEDRIKDDAKEILNRFETKGFEMFLISGDSEETTKKVAEELELKNFSFRTMPDEKEKIISKLQGEGKNVAMVGDGINDAPSLARANVGIAVGTGQDIAIDSADVILVKGDLISLVRSINISDKTVSIIKQNIFWAFFYNAITIPVAAGLFASYGITISPVLAAMFMAFSDVITVMINSLRLKYVNINKL
jgi:Cu+-exporting ATPase